MQKMENPSVPSTLEDQQRTKLAIDHNPGTGPRIVFCGGFKSHMRGTKACYLHALAQREGWAFTRFDYQGHGESPGDFEAGTLSCWLEDTLSVIDACGDEPLLLVGSSMGGWIALLAALKRPQRVAGLLVLACATDFTDALTSVLTPAQQDTLARDGRVLLACDYDDGEPYPITQALLTDGRQHQLLAGEIDVRCPVRILHGSADSDVPWQTSTQTLLKLKSDDARLLLVKDADHRLSDPAALAMIEEQLRALRDTLAPGNAP